jgi:hypothetical protein
LPRGWAMTQACCCLWTRTAACIPTFRMLDFRQSAGPVSSDGSQSGRLLNSFRSFILFASGYRRCRFEILERDIVSNHYSNAHCFRSIRRLFRLLGSRYVYQLIDAGRRCVTKPLPRHFFMPVRATRRATNKTAHRREHC